jgi:Fic family protein
VEGADEDHCPPGQIRKKDQNVHFGVPPHRGVPGGPKCEAAFKSLCKAIEEEFKGHDPLIQALAFHYHFAAMHPFLDGNGRTARVIEALLLERAGLKGTLFIAMSNYYYEEKIKYLKTLSEVRQKDHDLTSFLKFGLAGVSLQCTSLFNEIKTHVSKALFRNLMFDLFSRLESTRKRVMQQRQLKVLKTFLSESEIEWLKLVPKMEQEYKSLKNPRKALLRDVNYLIKLKALNLRISQKEKDSEKFHFLSVNLNWPMEMTESAFFESVKQLPKSKTHSFLCE